MDDEGICRECGKTGTVDWVKPYRGRRLTVMAWRHWRCECGHGWTDDVEWEREERRV